MTEKQADGNRMRIRRLLAIMGTTDVSYITEAATQAALASLRRTPMSPRRKPEDMPLVSPRTRNTYLKSLQSLLTWGLRNKFIDSNPLAGMACENEQVDVRHARTAYTDDEFRGLYQAALTSNRVIEGIDGPTRALAYFIAAATGLSRSELASVSPNSFDLSGEHPVVKIRAAHSKRRRQDTLPLTSQLVSYLKLALRDLPADKLVFPGLEKRKTHVMIKKDLAEAGLDYQNADGEFRDWHALRHTYVSRAWKSGAAAHVVKELARHADIRTTLSYSHNSREELRAAVDAVPQLPI
ncbi:tyrosine-type recombinase/integrase [Lacipirellula parvula]|nr:tyrosine-type recombinase/integrase [Lacipirellula parvula]